MHNVLVPQSSLVFGECVVSEGHEKCCTTPHFGVDVDLLFHLYLTSSHKLDPLKVSLHVIPPSGYDILIFDLFQD